MAKITVEGSRLSPSTFLAAGERASFQHTKRIDALISAGFIVKVDDETGEVVETEVEGGGTGQLVPDAENPPKRNASREDWAEFLAAHSALGITTEGKPVFVGLAPGTGESTDAWADFLTDLGDRGLGCPLLVVSDGAKGLIAAIEQIFPKALRQRCLIHRLRNVLAKIPAGMQAEVRDGYWAIFDTADLTVEPGPGLVEIIDKRIEAFAAKYFDLYPAAMRILLTDKAGLTAYLRFPVEHHGRVRHSNFIERSFGETKRRTKVIGRFPGETSAVSLVWAVLDRASAGWRGLSMTPVGTRLLHDLRRSLLDPPRELRLTPSTTSNGTNPADPISATA